MEAIYKILLFIHVAAGFLSLAAFWVPVFAKKRKGLHVQSGKVYTWLMWGVVLTAATMSTLSLFTGRYMTAAFLGFLSVATAHPLWYAVTILKYKRQVPDRVLQIRKGLNLLMFFFGAFLVAWSIVLKLEGQAVLLLIFGILGVGSYRLAFQKIEKTRSETNWLADHLEGMIITGIAAYTAFFAFGGRNIMGDLINGPLMVIPWTLPTVLGTIGIKWAKKKWKVAKPKKQKSAATAQLATE